MYYWFKKNKNTFAAEEHEAWGLLKDSRAEYLGATDGEIYLQALKDNAIQKRPLQHGRDEEAENKLAEALNEATTKELERADKTIKPANQDLVFGQKSQAQHHDLAVRKILG